MTPNPIERHDQNTHSESDDGESDTPFINSDKCFESDDEISVCITGNSNCSHFEFEKMQTPIETGNKHYEIDVTTQNNFAHEIPLDVMNDTNRLIRSNKHISLPTYNSNNTVSNRGKDLSINLLHRLPMDTLIGPRQANLVLIAYASSEGSQYKFAPSFTNGHINWTASSEFGTYRLCEQRRFRRACASAQSRQNLRCSLI